mgnify:CR=1 FL=1
MTRADGLEEGTTSVLTLPILISFSSAVTGVRADNFLVEGATLAEVSVQDGSSYTAVVQMSGVAAVTVKLDDLSGLVPTPTQSNVFSIVYTPAVHLTWSQGLSNEGVTSQLFVNVTATFASPVAAVDASCFSIVGATLTGFHTISSTVIVGRLELGLATGVSVWVPEAAGSINPPNTASAVLHLVYAPTVSISFSGGLTDGSTTDETTVDVEVSFGSKVAGIDVSHFVVSGATLSGFQPQPFPGQATSVTFTIALGQARNVSVSLQSRHSSPVPSVPSTTASLIYEPRPTLVLPSGISGNQTSRDQIPVTVAFPTPVVGVSVSHLVVSGATVDMSSVVTLPTGGFMVTLLTGAAASVTVDFPAAALGVHPINVAALPVSFDYFVPVVLTTSAQSVLPPVEDTQPLFVTVTFSNAVSNLSPSYFEVSGGLQVVSIRSVSETVFVANLSTVTAGHASIQLPERAGDVSPPNVASNVLSFDIVSLLTLSSAHVGEESRTALSVVSITATFSQAATGMTTDSVNVIGGVLLSLTAESGGVYTFTLSPNPGAYVCATILASSSGVSPAHTDASFCFHSSTVATLAWDVGGADKVSTRQVYCIAAFRDPVVGVSVPDFVVTGGTITSLEPVNATHLRVEVAIGSSSGISLQLVARPDQVIPFTEPSNTLLLGYVPAVVLSTPLGPSQATSSTTTSLVVRATFGSAVVGFTASSVVASGCEVVSVSALSTEVYDVAVDVIGTTQHITVDIPDSAPGVQPPNAAASSPFTFTYTPKATLTMPPTDVGASSVDITATFPTPVTGVDTSAFTVTGGAIVTSVVSVDGVDGNGTVFAVKVDASSASSATVSMGVGAGAVSPPVAASNILSLTYKPPVTLSWSNGLMSGDVTSLTEVTVTATFGSPVSGVALSDFQVAGGVVQSGSLVSSSSTAYSVVISLGADVDVSVTMLADSGSIIPSIAGSSSPLALVYHVGVVLSWDDVSVGSVTSAQSLVVRARFATPVTGVDSSFISLLGGSVAEVSVESSVIASVVIDLGSAATVSAWATAGAGAVHPYLAASDVISRQISAVPTIRFTSSSHRAASFTIVTKVASLSHMRRSWIWAEGCDVEWMELLRSQVWVGEVNLHVVDRRPCTLQVMPPVGVNASVQQSAKVLGPVGVVQPELRLEERVRSNAERNSHVVTLALGVTNATVDPRCVVCSNCSITSATTVGQTPSGLMLIQLDVQVLDNVVAATVVWQENCSLVAFKSAASNSVSLIQPPHVILSGPNAVAKEATVPVLLQWSPLPLSNVEKGCLKVTGGCSIESLHSLESPGMYEAIIAFRGAPSCGVFVPAYSPGIQPANEESNHITLLHKVEPMLRWRGAFAPGSPFVSGARDITVHVDLSAPCGEFSDSNLRAVGASVTSFRFINATRVEAALHMPGTSATIAVVPTASTPQLSASPAPLVFVLSNQTVEAFLEVEEVASSAERCQVSIVARFTGSVLSLDTSAFVVTGAFGEEAHAVTSIQDIPEGAGLVWRLQVTLPPVLHTALTITLPELTPMISPPLVTTTGISVDTFCESCVSRVLTFLSSSLSNSMVLTASDLLVGNTPVANLHMVASVQQHDAHDDVHVTVNMTGHMVVTVSPEAFPARYQVGVSIQNRALGAVQNHTVLVRVDGVAVEPPTPQLIMPFVDVSWHASLGGSSPVSSISSVDTTLPENRTVFLSSSILSSVRIPRHVLLMRSFAAATEPDWTFGVTTSTLTGASLSASNHAALPRYPTVQFIVSEWGVCDFGPISDESGVGLGGVCGSTFRHRSVRCVLRSSGEIVPDAWCSAWAQQAQPSTIEPCSKTCSQVAGARAPLMIQLSDWGPCVGPAACARGEQTRNVTCGLSRVPCAPLVAHAITTRRQCATPPKDGTLCAPSHSAPSWKFQPWLGCSEHHASRSTMVREAVCMSQTASSGAVPVHSSVCQSANGLVPPQEEDLLAPCPALSGENANGSCTVVFHTGLWSVCSERCGSLGVSTRDVGCTINGTLAGSAAECVAAARLHCNDLRIPAATKSCNRGSCELQGVGDSAGFRFVVGEWAPCSATCGGGTTARHVACIDMASGVHREDAQCIGVSGGMLPTVPSRSSTCANDPCDSSLCSTAWDCSIHGVCNATTSSCECSSGWEGPQCNTAAACPSGVVSAFGKCCEGEGAVIEPATGLCCVPGAQLDWTGKCCEVGVTVDACGVCGGQGRAIAATGACCVGDLDAAGQCCLPPLAVDACGICGGVGDCPLAIPLLDFALSRNASSDDATFALFERRLDSDAAESASGPVHTMEQLAKHAQAAVHLLPHHATASVSVTWDGSDRSHAVTPWVLTLTSGQHTPPFPANTWVQLRDAWKLAALKFPNAPSFTLDVAHAWRAPVCGNGVCEAGEVCHSHADVASPRQEGFTRLAIDPHSCCQNDCPYTRLSCPVDAYGHACSGHGVCISTTGQCTCHGDLGYTGGACDVCRYGWLKRKLADGTFACVAMTPLAPGAQATIVLTGNSEAGGKEAAGGSTNPQPVSSTFDFFLMGIAVVATIAFVGVALVWNHARRNRAPVVPSSRYENEHNDGANPLALVNSSAVSSASVPFTIQVVDTTTTSISLAWSGLPSSCAVDGHVVEYSVGGVAFEIETPSAEPSFVIGSCTGVPPSAPLLPGATVRNIRVTTGCMADGRALPDLVSRTVASATTLCEAPHDLAASPGLDTITIAWVPATSQVSARLICRDSHSVIQSPSRLGVPSASHLSPKAPTQASQRCSSHVPLQKASPASNQTQSYSRRLADQGRIRELSVIEQQAPTDEASTTDRDGAWESSDCKSAAGTSANTEVLALQVDAVTPRSEPGNRTRTDASSDMDNLACVQSIPKLLPAVDTLHLCRETMPEESDTHRFAEGGFEVRYMRETGQVHTLRCDRSQTQAAIGPLPPGASLSFVSVATVNSAGDVGPPSTPLSGPIYLLSSPTMQTTVAKARVAVASRTSASVSWDLPSTDALGRLCAGLRRLSSVTGASLTERRNGSPRRWGHSNHSSPVRSSPSRSRLGSATASPASRSVLTPRLQGHTGPHIVVSYRVTTAGPAARAGSAGGRTHNSASTTSYGSTVHTFDTAETVAAAGTVVGAEWRTRNVWPALPSTATGHHDKWAHLPTSVVLEGLPLGAWVQDVTVAVALEGERGPEAPALPVCIHLPRWDASGPPQHPVAPLPAATFTDEGLALAWRAPLCTGGGTISGYRVSYTIRRSAECDCSDTPTLEVGGTLISRGCSDGGAGAASGAGAGAGIGAGACAGAEAGSEAGPVAESKVNSGMATTADATQRQESEPGCTEHHSISLPADTFSLGLRTDTGDGNGKPWQPGVSVVMATVCAITEAGEGDRLLLCEHMPCTTNTVAGAPSHVEVGPRCCGGVTLLWREPSWPGSHPVSEYRVEFDAVPELLSAMGGKRCGDQTPVGRQGLDLVEKKQDATSVRGFCIVDDPAATSFVFGMMASTTMTSADRPSRDASSPWLRRGGVLLRPGSTFRNVVVRAVTDAGLGAPSAPPLAIVSTQSLTSSAPPQNVALSAPCETWHTKKDALRRATSVVVTWLSPTPHTAGMSTISAYRINYSTKGVRRTVEVLARHGTHRRAHRFVIGGGGGEPVSLPLAFGAVLDDVRVAAVTDAGVGEWARPPGLPFACARPPLAPVNVCASCSRPGVVDVSWTLSTEEEGKEGRICDAPIAHWRVQYTLTPEVASLEQPCSSTTVEHCIPAGKQAPRYFFNIGRPLPEGTVSRTFAASTEDAEHTPSPNMDAFNADAQVPSLCSGMVVQGIRLAAESSVGIGCWSDKCPDIVLPSVSAPQRVRVADFTASSVTLTWAAPFTAPETKVIGYRVAFVTHVKALRSHAMSASVRRGTSPRRFRVPVDVFVAVDSLRRVDGDEIGIADATETGLYQCVISGDAPPTVADVRRATGAFFSSPSSSPRSIGSPGSVTSTASGSPPTPPTAIKNRPGTANLAASALAAFPALLPATVVDGITVRALTASKGEGPPCKPLQGVTTAPAAAPAAPTGLVASNTPPTHTSLPVEWTPPTEDGGLPITGYEIRYWCRGGAKLVADSTSSTAASHNVVPEDDDDGSADAPPQRPPTGCARVRGGTTCATLGGTRHSALPSGGMVVWAAVRARNNIGWGPLSSPLRLQGLAPVTTPGMPRRVLTTRRVGAVDLSWDAPEDDGGSPGQGYRVSVWLGAGGSTRSDGGVHSDTITDPDNTNACTEEGAPWRSFHVPTTRATLNSATAGWSGTPAPHAMPRVEIVAVNAQGAGPAAVLTSLSPLAPPTAPTDLRVMNSGFNSVYLQWHVPASSGGSDISHYKISFSRDGTSHNVTTQHPGEDSIVSCELGGPHTQPLVGLTPGAAVTNVRVVAVNAIGESVPSEALESATTLAKSVAAAPSFVTATRDASTPSHVIVEWSPPRHTGGCDVLDYVVRYSLSQARVEVRTNHPDACRFVVGGGCEGTANAPLPTDAAVSNIQVAAVTSHGVGAYSDAVSARRTIPQAPTHVACGSIRHTSFQLSWRVQSRTAPGTLTMMHATIGHRTWVLEVPTMSDDSCDGGTSGVGTGAGSSLTAGAGPGSGCGQTVSVLISSHRATSPGRGTLVLPLQPGQAVTNISVWHVTDDGIIGQRSWPAVSLHTTHPLPEAGLAPVVTMYQNRSKTAATGSSRVRLRSARSDASGTARPSATETVATVAFSAVRAATPPANVRDIVTHYELQWRRMVCASAASGDTQSASPFAVAWYPLTLPASTAGTVSVVDDRPSESRLHKYAGRLELSRSPGSLRGAGAAAASASVRDMRQRIQSTATKLAKASSSRQLDAELPALMYVWGLCGL